MAFPQQRGRQNAPWTSGGGGGGGGMFGYGARINREGGVPGQSAWGPRQEMQWPGGGTYGGAPGAERQYRALGVTGWNAEGVPTTDGMQRSDLVNAGTYGDPTPWSLTDPATLGQFSQQQLNRGYGWATPSGGPAYERGGEAYGYGPGQRFVAGNRTMNRDFGPQGFDVNDPGSYAGYSGFTNPQQRSTGADRPGMGATGDLSWVGQVGNRPQYPGPLGNDGTFVRQTPNFTPQQVGFGAGLEWAIPGQAQLPGHNYVPIGYRADMWDRDFTPEEANARMLQYLPQGTTSLGGGRFGLPVVPGTPWPEAPA